MNYPTELQLLEFFGVEAVEYDDVTTYTVCDERGLELSVSFNVMDDSFQTSIRFMGKIVEVVSYEGMTRLWIDENRLSAEFSQLAYKTSVTVMISPYIEILWSNLRII